MPGAKKKPSSLPQVSLMGVPMQRRRLIRGQMPAWNFNFRVTTLLAEKTAARPLPEWIGERTLLTVGDRLRLLGVCAFHRGCSQGMACPFLAAVLHQPTAL